MTEIHVIDADTYQDVENQLREAYKKMEPAETVADQRQNLPMTNGHRLSNASRKTGGFAIILNGHSLVIVAVI